MDPFTIAAIGAGIGGLAGSQKDKTQTDSTTTSSVDMKDMFELNRGQGAAAELGGDIQMGQLGQLRDLLTQGGQQQVAGDITAGRGEQMKLMEMLRGAQGMFQGQGPSQQDIGQGQSFAQSMFAPQQQAMQQQFQQAETNTSRLAARLGRQVDDPILRAKLAESQGQQMGQLQAQQGAFAANAAQQFQGQRQQGALQGISMQEQIGNVRGGLASQALQNRQALMGMGQSMLQGERNFRLGAATRTSDTQQGSSSGGGLGDILGGALGGAGGLVKAFGGF